jgi:hypothetical protein
VWKSPTALHNLIVQYFPIILVKILQALSNWLLIIARKPSSFATDFQAKVETVTRPLRHIQVLLGKQLRPAERRICLSVSVGKQIEPDFPLGLCLCLAPFCFFFVMKNSSVLKYYKHIHNMMQPPLCLKKWRVVLSNVFYWICPKHNTLYSGQKVNCFATFLQYYFSTFLQTCMFWNFCIPYKLPSFHSFN